VTKGQKGKGAEEGHGKSAVSFSSLGYVRCRQGGGQEYTVPHRDGVSGF